MRNMSLLQETIQALRIYDKTENDVFWVGGMSSFPTRRLARVSWNEFKSIAKDVYYDNGFGGQEISEALIIVGDNWWLERAEYDGSEWWRYIKKPESSDYGPIEHGSLEIKPINDY